MMWGNNNSGNNNNNNNNNTSSSSSSGNHHHYHGGGMVGDDDGEIFLDPLQQLVMSMDCLCGQRFLDQRMNNDDYWVDPNPSWLLSNENAKSLKYKCRADGSRGIPPAMRCAIWITSIVRNCHPERPNLSDYGTLRKVRILDHGWTIVSQDLELPPPPPSNSSTGASSSGLPPPPLMGLSQEQMDGLIESYPKMTKKGKEEWIQLLYAAQYVLGLDYCPLLPDIAAVLLSYMPVSYAYAVIREMITTTNTSYYYFPTSPRQHQAWCQTFIHLLQQHNPSLATILLTLSTSNNNNNNDNNYYYYHHQQQQQNHNNNMMNHEWLNPIFQTLFRTIFKRTDVWHMFDLYMLEGSKVLFRIGLSLLTLCQPYLEEYQKNSSLFGRRRNNNNNNNKQSSSSSFWNGIHRITHSSTFHFHTLLRSSQSYYHHTSSNNNNNIHITKNNAHHPYYYSNNNNHHLSSSTVRSRLRKRNHNNKMFPKRSTLIKLMEQFESQLELSFNQQSSLVAATGSTTTVATTTTATTTTNNISTTTTRPLGLQKQQQVNSSHTTHEKVPIAIPIVLAKEAIDRIYLKQWLPIPMQNTKLDIIYSTNIHGRSTEQFYKYCQHSKHTLTIMEVLKTGARIGMYATHEWHADCNVYGDGECFLFRLRPDPICYKWTSPTHPPSTNTTTRNNKNKKTNNDNTTTTTTTIINQEDSSSSSWMEQFIMISRHDFISMGIGKDNNGGDSGLRLNDDLTIGTSNTAIGFHNQPLPGNNLTTFEIGLVEVYRFIREVDGKAVDNNQTSWTFPS